MSIIIFIISAVISAFSAFRLAKYANDISRETKLGGFLAGTILLAVATSLPELTATVSASIIGNPDIVVGNGLGSILFNIFVLFLLDIYFRKSRLFLHVSDHHLYTGTLALLLCTISAIGLAVNPSFSIFNVSMISFAIAIVYFGGMWFISRQQEGDTSFGNSEVRSAASTTNRKRAVKGFLLFTLIIFIAGSSLSLSGDAMARSTGISSTLVGSILIAMATSLPDAMSIYSALKLANINMAIGAIFGSNIFNIFVVAIGDIFYFEGSIWQDTSDDLIFISFVGFFLTAIVMIIIKRDHTRTTFTYILPSLIAVTSYLAVVGYVIFR